MKTVNLTINGKAVTVPANYTILDAAKQLNINIPTLCYCAHLGSGECNKPARLRRFSTSTTQTRQLAGLLHSPLPR